MITLIIEICLDSPKTNDFQISKYLLHLYELFEKSELCNKRVLTVKKLASQAVLPLHDHLLFFKKCQRTQEMILMICELIWKINIPFKQSVMIQAYPIIIKTAVHTQKTADIRRCYRIKEALLVFDFKNPSLNVLKNTIYKACSSPHFLKSLCGRRYLSYAFSLEPLLTCGFIDLIKNKLPSERKSVLSTLGDVLFRSWFKSNDQCKLVLDEALQTFTRSSIICGNKKIQTRLQILIKSFNRKKDIKHVNSLLYKCYDPLLINSFWAPNAIVRKNALLIMGEVYPIQDPSRKSSDINEALIIQQNALFHSLSDNCPEIRSTTANILSLLLLKFLPSFPAGFACKVFAFFSQVLVFDMTSTKCRVAAINGIGAMLALSEIRPLLKIFIKKLFLILNDPSEMVRISFATLLYYISRQSKTQNNVLITLELCVQGLITKDTSIALIFHRILMSLIIKDLNYNGGYDSIVPFLKNYSKAGIIFCKFSLMKAKLMLQNKCRYIPGLTISQVSLIARKIFDHIIRLSRLSSLNNEAKIRVSLSKDRKYMVIC
jgi:condensin-2 complex subunit G2